LLKSSVVLTHTHEYLQFRRWNYGYGLRSLPWGYLQGTSSNQTFKHSNLHHRKWCEFFFDHIKTKVPFCNFCTKIAERCPLWRRKSFVSFLFHSHKQNELHSSLSRECSLKKYDLSKLRICLKFIFLRKMFYWGQLFYNSLRYRLCVMTSILILIIQWCEHVTPTGVADASDTLREKWIRRYLYAVSRALKDGIDIRGYFYWSLLDNFGITHVEDCLLILFSLLNFVFW
jgi:hypothetical protein